MGASHELSVLGFLSQLLGLLGEFVSETPLCRVFSFREELITIKALPPLAFYSLFLCPPLPSPQELVSTFGGLNLLHSTPASD